MGFQGSPHLGRLSSPSGAEAPPIAVRFALYGTTHLSWGGWKVFHELMVRCCLKKPPDDGGKESPQKAPESRWFASLNSPRTGLRKGWLALVILGSWRNLTSGTPKTRTSGTGRCRLFFFALQAFYRCYIPLMKLATLASYWTLPWPARKWAIIWAWAGQGH